MTRELSCALPSVDLRVRDTYGAQNTLQKSQSDKVLEINGVKMPIAAIVAGPAPHNSAACAIRRVDVDRSQRLVQICHVRNYALRRKVTQLRINS